MFSSLRSQTEELLEMHEVVSDAVILYHKTGWILTIPAKARPMAIWSSYPKIPEDINLGIYECPYHAL